MFLEASDKLKDFIRQAFYVFIAVFPFILYEGYLFHGTSSKAVNTILFVQVLVIIIGVYLIKNNRKKLSFSFSPISIVLFILLLVLVLSSIFGVDFHSSFWSKVTRTTGIFYFLHLALLYIIFWIGFGDKKNIRKLLYVFVVSSVIFSLASVFGQEGVGWFFKSKPWQGLTIGNSTFAGMYLYSAFMASIYLVFTPTDNPNIKSNSNWHQKWKFLFPIIIFFNPYTFNFGLFRGDVGLLDGVNAFIGSAQTSSITLYISVIALAIFWIFSKIKNTKLKKIALIAGVIFGLTAILFGSLSLISSGGKVQEIYLSQSSAARPLVWNLSKQAIGEKPLLGWGVDNFDAAYQNYYDNSVLERSNGGEAWFDRAHNILIDQTTESGYLGVAAYILVYLVILGCLAYVILRSAYKNDQILSVVLLVYFLGHLLELQTAFDTTVSYLPLIVFSAISAILFYHTQNNNKDITVISPFNKFGGLFVVMLSLCLFIWGTYPIMKSQAINGSIRRVGSSEKRILLYPNLFRTPIDLPTFLWTTSNDIQRGVSFDSSVLENPKTKEAISEEITAIIGAYENYVKDNPDNARLLLNLADFYIYQRMFDVDNLDKAHNVLDAVTKLMPHSPQPYWMKSVAYLYQAKFQEAKLSAEKAYNLNPKIEESKRLKEYIDKSIKTFPVIELYNFKQI